MSCRPLRLSRSPKVGSTGNHRTVPVEATWRRLKPILESLGVTRLADITGLDRLGIPTYSCVRPISTPFGVTVTCGKGLRPIDAMVGAVMESAEYKLSEPAYGAHRSRIARRRELTGNVLDPRELILPPWVKDVDEPAYEWIEGWDIAKDEAIWVPAAAVYSFDPRGTFLFETTTNGLASGNTLEEAILHALLELIERDATSIAESFLSFPGHESKYPSVDEDTLPRSSRVLAERFHAAGVELFIRNVTSDLGIAAFDVGCFESHGEKFLAHGGSGAHLVAEIALNRALTETAQSRAADIQGSREDLTLTRRRGADAPSSFARERTEPVSFATVPNHLHSDLLDDIGFIIERLRAAGMPRVIVVDLSSEVLGIPCAKVVVPGLDQCCVDFWRAGPRLAEQSRNYVQQGRPS